MADETKQSSTKEDTISLLDLFAVIVKRRRLIVVTTLLAALLIVLFSIYTIKMPPDSRWNPLPNVYKPKVEVLLQDSSSSSSILSSLSSELGTLASLAGLTKTGSSSADLAQALLKGNTIIDQVVEEFNIKERVKNSKTPLTASRDFVRKPLKAEFTSTTGILSITYESIDPEFATAVINRLVDLLEMRFKSLTMEKLTRKKTFLEDRLKEVEAELMKAQRAVVNFQRKYGVIDLGVQAEEQIKQYTTLTSSLFQKELELQTLKEYLRDTDPQVVRMKNEIEVSKRLLQEMKSGFKEFSLQGIPQDKMPEVATEYYNLERDLSIQAEIYKLLRQQYETSKIEETDNTKTFQIIEKAEVPEVKSGPGRGKVCMIVTIAAFFLSIFVAFILEYFDRVKRNPEEAEKLENIKAMFGRKKRT